MCQFESLFPNYMTLIHHTIFSRNVSVLYVTKTWLFKGFLVQLYSNPLARSKTAPQLDKLQDPKEEFIQFTVQKYFKSQFGVHHHEELAEPIKMNKSCVRFGIRAKKL